LTAAAVAAIAVAILAGLAYLSDTPSLRGSVIDPPLPAAEISLTDVQGRPFRLSGVRGNVALIYFGFTHCPDECPLTMANLKLAVDLLGSGADRTMVILVTTDPHRDTPEALREYLGRFNTAFLGLTGTPAQLATAWKDYGVTVMDGGETHSNYIYVIDTSGNLVETFLPDAGPADIAADIRTLLDEN
jgi:protein SCO1/2